MSDYFYDEDGNMIGDSEDYGKLMYKTGRQDVLKELIEFAEKEVGKKCAKTDFIYIKIIEKVELWNR